MTTRTPESTYREGFDESDFINAMRDRGKSDWRLINTEGDRALGGKNMDNELYPKILLAAPFSADEGASTYKRDIVSVNDPLRPIIPLIKYEFLQELSQSDRPELSVPAKLNLTHKAYSRWQPQIRVRRKGILGRLGFTRLEQPQGQILETFEAPEPDVIELAEPSPVQISGDVGALGM